MTDQLDTGDTFPSEVAGLWVPVAELAKMRGVARQVMYRRVDRLTTEGRIKPRLDARGSKLINVAEFDNATSETTDLGKTLAAGARALTPRGAAGLAYQRDQARKMAYAADLAQLDLEERRGRLVRKDLLVDALSECGRVIALHIDGMAHWADDVAVAATREGAPGVRRLLREKARMIRERIAAELAVVSQAAPDPDPPLDRIEP